jgi:chemotaxis regulatin CheY-phosphate phosphatase CheZ
MSLDSPRSRLIAGLAALAVLIVVLLLILGGGGTPEDEARQTAEEFTGAVEEGDFEAACGVLSDELRTGIGGDQCAERLSTTVGEAGEGLEIVVTAVRVSGPQAVAETEVSRPGAETPQESTLELVQTGDVWRISSLGDR